VGPVQLARGTRPHMIRAQLPGWLEPMAATLTTERFIDSAWGYERKYDGIRMLAYKQGNLVQLWSRNRLSLTEAYPSVVQALAALPLETAIFDGEAVGAWQRLSGADYYVFDVLWLDGEETTSLPLRRRQALLAGVPFASPVERVSAIESVEDDPPWERACREGWEGVIAKRLDSPYRHGRSRDWLKMKCEASQELVVGGFTDPEGRRVGVGALLVGYFEDSEFVYAGKVGTGLTAPLLLNLRARLDRLQRASSPFTRGTGIPRTRVHWVEPELVVQVAFSEWTVHGKLRHPRFVTIRTDKPARDVVRERT
jgi:bifunctional non-homologous end joining protein LigD